MKRNIAATVATILSALLFIVIGSCFSAFIYKKELIEVDNPGIVLASGMAVFSEEDKEINELELSKMKLGLKPATGEEDVETNIPTTVTDKQGSEGQYAKFKLFAPNGANIYITNISIESEESEEDIKKERENIMVAIEEINESVVSLKEDKVLVGKVEPSGDRVEYTFYIWLGAKTSDKLEASKISFDISFEPLS